MKIAQDCAVLVLLFAPILAATTSCMPASPFTRPAYDTKTWSQEAQEKRDLLVGKWLSESRGKNDSLKLSLIERNENGTYRAVFRTYSDSDYEEAVEVGLWGISGSSYFTIMRGWIIDGRFSPSDPTRAYYYDAYRVSDLNATSFEYESLESGNRHSNQRVGDDFRFSD